MFVRQGRSTICFRISQSLKQAIKTGITEVKIEGLQGRNWNIPVVGCPILRLPDRLRIDIL